MDIEKNHDPPGKVAYFANIPIEMYGFLDNSKTRITYL